MVQIEVESISEEIAEAIRNIDAAVKKMSASGLSDKAIVVLLQDLIGPRNIKRMDIENVLWGMRNLKQTYLEK